MISIQGLTYRYKQGPTLQFADWHLKQQEQWLLLGASGSGKSTLINIMSGLLRPESGRVEISGTSLYGLSARELDRFRGRHIGIVFQRPHLVRSLRVAENLELAQSMAGLRSDRKRIDLLLGELGLSEKSDRYPDELSQGQLQRLSVARALVNKPLVLIADEPTSSLDDQNAESVIALLREQAAANEATLLIATHDKRVRDHLNNEYIL
ncbi:ABC transporter ATP-binding protein [Pedobacter yulinensis]|uniref:ABC transporter ATP-binding protein n=1 Tax=Pedobacter yulinensis TaxID=2126353 RepID=A0A2T3HLP5_9SPHI|nr:ATP-binding cassette domain-containing protein [Pedobacter yulinensis]PST83349.1 ABC transporter ATP-binding protein [Pedobacter yulinensis]